jgi:ABC-type multidrug transport system ATPase subunit
MIVGPIKALFMDEISTGLDSSTTFQIVTCLQQLVHITDATAVLSLLQPAPETFELFDDLILMAEGKIVYHGPCSQAIQFFRDCGFWCPERKGVADFLQEVGMETVSLTFVEYYSSGRISLSQSSSDFPHCLTSNKFHTLVDGS